MSSEPSSSSPKHGRPAGPKRRNRIAVSCFSCRALKTKCDGAKPACSTCRHNQRECTYSERGIPGSTGKIVVVNQEYLVALERRLEALERDHASTPAPSRQGYDASQTGSASRPQNEGSGQILSTVIADADVSMGGVSFTQLILNALHGHENVKAYSRPVDDEVREAESSLTENDLYTLPANAPELLDQFFELRHPLSPVFHVPSIRPLLESAIHCQQEQRHRHHSMLALVNMIFAICTSHWVIDTEGNPRSARRHYDIAIALLQPNILRDWKLEHVQALLIGARYLQGSSCANECWNILGLAIRIAYGLRLHKEPPATDPRPLRETKRRIWYAAYTLDVLLSMIYDRPAMIRSSECSVGLPEDLDDDYIQSAPSPAPPSSMSFSIEVIKLYRMIETFKLRLNGDTNDARKIAELVMPLDEEYRNWHKAIPLHLKLDFKAPREQPWILALRGNMVRILVHRQSLMVMLRGRLGHQNVEDSVTSHALQYSRTICINAAMESIDIVSLRYEQTKRTLGLNWFNIYYLFNAVIVLVSHIIDPAYSHDRIALAKVDMALHMVQAMSNNHAFAQRAFTFLQQLLGYMHSALSMRQYEAATNSNSTFTTISPNPAPPRPSMPTTFQGGAGLVENAEPTLHTLFGLTQDLTDNLESYLESFDGTDFTMQLG